MENLKKKLTEESRVLVIGVFFGVLLGLSAGIFIQGINKQEVMSKSEIGKRTEEFLNQKVLIRKNMTVEYLEVADSTIPGVYNITVKVKELNITTNVLVSKDGKWFLQNRKIT